MFLECVCTENVLLLTLAAIVKYKIAVLTHYRSILAYRIYNMMNV